eukprot:TRINITY_DN4162_c0_g1_i1.p1 TRINITY_DN4162_c0_g1~~TRINITY_DN4162_c0_g1_i1.p1  ORF type:complete len:1004 (-),score=160.99 TRINITY_DN4162_c0_g1_i1:150-3161(-)
MAKVDEKKVGKIIGIQFYDGAVLSTLYNQEKASVLCNQRKKLIPSGSYPTNDRYVIIHTENFVFFWDYSTNQWSLIDSPSVGGKLVTCLQILTQIPHCLALGCSDGAIRLWNMQTWSCTAKIPISKSTIIHIAAIFKEETFIVTVSADFVVSVANVASSTSQTLCTLTCDELQEFCFNYRTAELVVLTNKGVVTMDIDTKEKVSHVSMPKRYIATSPFYHFGFSQDTVVGLSLTRTHIAAFDVTQRIVDHLYLLWIHKLKHNGEPLKQIIGFKIHPVFSHQIFVYHDKGVSLVAVHPEIRSPNQIVLPHNGVPHVCFFEKQKLLGYPLPDTVPTHNLGEYEIPVASTSPRLSRTSSVASNSPVHASRSAPMMSSRTSLDASVDVSLKIPESLDEGMHSPTVTPRTSTFGMSRAKSSRMLVGVTTPRAAASQIVSSPSAPVSSYHSPDLSPQPSLSFKDTNVSSHAEPAQIFTAAYPMQARLSVSPSKAYIIIFWEDHCKFQVVRVADWAVLTEGDAKSVAWCNYKDNFVVLHPSIDSKEEKEINEVLEQEKGLRKILLEKRYKGQKLQDNWTKFEKKVKKDKLKNSADTATPGKVEYDTGICRFSVREIDDVLGGTHAIGSRVFNALWAGQVYGGTLIGVKYVAKSSNEPEEKERERLKLLRFYTWPKDKEKVREVGPPMVAPLDIVWDPSFSYCLFIWENRFKIYECTPKWQQQYVGEGVSVISATWHNKVLYLATQEKILCLFPEKQTWTVTAGTVGWNALYSFNIPNNFFGPVSLIFNPRTSTVGVVHPDQRSYSTIHSQNSNFKFYSLVQAGLVSEALKWANTVESSVSQDQFADFLVHRGYLREALELNIPAIKKFNMCVEYRMNNEIVKHLKEVVAQHVHAPRHAQQKIIKTCVEFVTSLTSIPGNASPPSLRGQAPYYQLLPRSSCSSVPGVVLPATSSSQTKLIAGIYRALTDLEPSFYITLALYVKMERERKGERENERKRERKTKRTPSSLFL